MCNMITFDFEPSICQWIFKSGDPANAVAVAEKDSHWIRVFDGKGAKDPLKVIEFIHRKPVCAMTYNVVFETVISADVSGMIEFWMGPKHLYESPTCVKFEYKTDTDLYEVAKCKAHCTNLSVSNKGTMFAAVCSDKF